MLYCSRCKNQMTPRTFEKAQESFEKLLDNIRDRNMAYSVIPERIKDSIDGENKCVANISERQAVVLARTIVYKGVGDDLNLYPITAEDHLQRSKLRGSSECSIPDDEMLFEDCMYVINEMMKGANFSRETMTSCFNRFRKFNLDPNMSRVYAGIYYNNGPVEIESLPGFQTLVKEYRKAAKDLVDLGYLKTEDNIFYSLTEKKIKA